MLVKKILCSAVLVLGIFGLTTTASFAQDYNNGYYNQQYNSYNSQYQQPYNYNYSYNQPGQYQYPIQPVYQSNGYYAPQYQQPVYQPQYTYTDNSSRAAKIKKAVTYGAIGAGAGYLFSKPGSRGKNTAIGAGLGAALGYLLKGY